VLNKVSKLEGERRVAHFELLSGESAETFHRENGYTYKMDVRKVFFNPRLYWERARVASKVLPEESILIPFAGVGPFVLPPAGRRTAVCAIEINPDACACLKENVRLNKLEKQVTVIQGDADFILSHPDPVEAKGFQVPENGFDRAIVPTPYGMDHFLGKVAELVKKGGYIHFYTFKTENQIPELIEDYRRMGLDVEFYRRTGNVAPGVSRWVFDLIKE
jgi:tRNA (guanine37-N1)-methyltransferase